VLLNLFIAIVLEHFELDEDEKYRKQLEMYFERHQSKKKQATEYFQYVHLGPRHDEGSALRYHR